MFKNDITQTYNHLDASMEILILLLGAFLLGFLTCWLFRKFTEKDSSSAPLSNINSNERTTLNANHNQDVKSNLIQSPNIESKHPNLSKSEDEGSNFNKIKSINTNIESLLFKNDIKSYTELGNIKKETFDKILNSQEVNHIAKNEVKTWPHQADLASKKEWKKLSEYQNFIKQEFSAESSTKKTSLQKTDDLQKVKGIDSEIEKILNAEGISTYSELKTTDANALKEIIYTANKRFSKNQTSTWSHQASLAEKSNWEELKVYQEFMDDININSQNLAATTNVQSIKTQTGQTENRSSQVSKPQPLNNNNSDIQNQQYSRKEDKQPSDVYIPEKNIGINTELNKVNFKQPSYGLLDSSAIHNKYNDSNSTHETQTDNSKLSKTLHDNLQKLEGIDPEVETLLNHNKIHTFQQLHNNDRNSLKSILNKGGKQFQSLEPKSWPHQSGMAHRGEWKELKTYQSFISKESDTHSPAEQRTVKDTKISNAISNTNNKKDDLKKVEGIGPKIESLLNDANILTFKDLTTNDRNTLKSLLDEAGPQYRMHEPETWPIQADFAHKNEWDKLKEYQNHLTAGRE